MLHNAINTDDFDYESRLKLMLSLQVHYYYTDGKLKVERRNAAVVWQDNCGSWTTWQMFDKDVDDNVSGKGDVIGKWLLRHGWVVLVDEVVVVAVVVVVNDMSVWTLQSEWLYEYCKLHGVLMYC